jgi:hypothetical protein
MQLRLSRSPSPRTASKHSSLSQPGQPSLQCHPLVAVRSVPRPQPPRSRSHTRHSVCSLPSSDEGAYSSCCGSGTGSQAHPPTHIQVICSVDFCGPHFAIKTRCLLTNFAGFLGHNSLLHSPPIYSLPLPPLITVSPQSISDPCTLSALSPIYIYKRRTATCDWLDL